MIPSSKNDLIKAEKPDVINFVIGFEIVEGRGLCQEDLTVVNLRPAGFDSITVRDSMAPICRYVFGTSRLLNCRIRLQYVCYSRDSVMIFVLLCIVNYESYLNHF